MAKVGLIFPCTDTTHKGAEIDQWDYKGVPIGLLSIASFLESRGHLVRVVDTMLYDKKEVDKRLNDLSVWSDIIGLSVMTTQIRHALDISLFIKKKDHAKTIVWGGIHPTLFPEQTCENESIDYVIYGEGEYAFLELVNHLQGVGPNIDGIKNLVYTDSGRVKKNAPGELLDVGKLPKLSYDLLDIQGYIERSSQGKAVRGLDILTSRGCPYRCSFCANTILLGQKWRARDIEIVFEELNELIKKYEINNLWVMDDYFFGSKKRPEKFASHLIENDYKLTWEANVRANDLSSSRLSNGYLDLMKESGLVGLKIGAESGSDDTLKLLKKDITSDQIISAVERCIGNDITPYLYFINGIPGESIAKIKKTITFMYHLKSDFPGIFLNGPGIFRPYPGGELYQKCLDAGYRDPDTLVEWAERDLGSSYVATKNLPWVPEPGFVDDLHWYLYKACPEERILKYRFKFHRNILEILARWRFDNDFWHFRVESKIVNYTKKILNRYAGA